MICCYIKGGCFGNKLNTCKLKIHLICLSKGLHPVAFQVFILAAIKTPLEDNFGKAQRGSCHQKESVVFWISIEAELRFLSLFLQYDLRSLR